MSELLEQIKAKLSTLNDEVVTNKNTVDALIQRIRNLKGSDNSTALQNQLRSAQAELEASKQAFDNYNRKAEEFLNTVNNSLDGLITNLKATNSTQMEGGKRKTRRGRRSRKAKKSRKSRKGKSKKRRR